MSYPPTTQAPGLYLGWLVVAGAFSVLAISYGMQFSFGVFLPYMSADLGWDRSTLTAPFSLYVLVYTWLSFVSGRLTDRLGPRSVIAVGALGLGAGYMLLGTVEAVWEPYLYLCVFAGIGASVAFVPCHATVIRWFVRRRGLALGIASAGVSAAAVVGPPVAAVLIKFVGWREALYLLGAGAAAAMLIASRAMLRDPESRNLLPDGDPLESPSSSVDPHSWTLAEARHTVTFWLLMTSLFFSWLAIFVPFVHLTAYALELGIPGIQSATLLGMLGIGGLAGRVFGGGLTDRVGRMPGLAVSIVLQGLAFIGFSGSGSFAWLAWWAFAFGMGYGGVSVLFPALLGDYFGRAHAGEIVGYFFAIGGCAAAAGPYFAGAVYDATGQYHGAFLTAAILNGVALALLTLVRRP